MQKIPPRPQFHFTARRGWLNDPNGLVVLGSRYHMYFQHNPEAPEWGNIHWGHAVSDDLLHWEELPIALAPKAENDLCFSGSAFLDTENASGLGTPENPALLVYFTSTGRGECLAYSLDGGMTFTEYENNPVIRHRGRDPRILRYAPGHYVIAVYDEVNHIAFYRSADLKNWTFCSRITASTSARSSSSSAAGGCFSAPTASIRSAASTERPLRRRRFPDRFSRGTPMQGRPSRTAAAGSRYSGCATMEYSAAAASASRCRSRSN